MDDWLVYALIPLYLLPSVIAVARRHMYTVRICLVNVFLGWTIYAWVVALVWSCTLVPRWDEPESGFRSRFFSYFQPFQ